jgi:hypothetical protein
MWRDGCSPRCRESVIGLWTRKLAALMWKRACRGVADYEAVGVCVCVLFGVATLSMGVRSRGVSAMATSHVRHGAHAQCDKT